MSITFDALDAIAHQAAITVAPGTVLFEDGQTGDSMYAVIGGEVELWHHWRLLDVVKAGQVFGEMALIDDQPRSATAIARTACELIVIDKRHFDALVMQTPGFARSVMHHLAQRLRAANTN
jgi:CRP-like cAMP-binding protein